MENMVYFLKRRKSTFTYLTFSFVLFCFVGLIPNQLHAQRSNGNAIPKSISQEQIGGINYDYNKETRVVAFVDLLNQNLNGSSRDKFQTLYKFNEEDIQDWVLQYVDESIDYELEDLDFAFDKVRETTHAGFNKLNALCGYNFKVAEVVGYSPDYADPERKSYMVKLRLRLSSDDEEQYLQIILGYIKGKFLIFDTQKRAL